MTYRVKRVNVASKRTGAPDPELVAAELGSLAQQGQIPVSFGVVGAELFVILSESAPKK